MAISKECEMAILVTSEMIQPLDDNKAAAKKKRFSNQKHCLQFVYYRNILIYQKMLILNKKLVPAKICQAKV